MKRILLGIGLPLAIVAVAWQFAPADVEVEVGTNGDKVAAEPKAVADESPNADVAIAASKVVVSIDETSGGEAVARPDPVRSSRKANGKVDFARLLKNNPELVDVLLDNIEGEYAEMMQMTLLSMEGAAVPYLMNHLDKDLTDEKREFMAGAIVMAALFPDYPIDAVMPKLIKMAKSKDEKTRELGLAIITQVLYFHAMPEEMRTVQRMEILTNGL